MITILLFSRAYCLTTTRFRERCELSPLVASSIIGTSGAKPKLKSYHHSLPLYSRYRNQLRVFETIDMEPFHHIFDQRVDNIFLKLLLAHFTLHGEAYVFIDSLLWNYAVVLLEICKPR